MFLVFFILSLLSLLAIIIGLIKPNLVIKWNTKNNNRKTVIKVYLTLFILFFILSMTLSPNDATDRDNNVIMKEENSDNTNKSASKQEETKEDNEVFVFDQDFLNSTKGQVNSKIAAEYFIEKYEKQKIKKLKINSIAIYSADTVRDKAGNEFPYSSMVSGEYEEKGTGRLRNFIMTLVYDTEDSVKEGNAKCAQYINDDTGKYINFMNEEDDVILKLIKALNNN